MGLFGPKLPIDRDELDFQLATFKWLEREFGPVRAEAPLITPSRDWFAAERPCGPAGVHALFDEVRAAAGMADWPVNLVEGEATRPVDGGNAHLIQHEGAPPPCGTFEVREELGIRQAIISYNPAMAADEAGMVATFAHELGHYLMASAQSDPPGGWDLHELHTDLVGVYLGFGIFMANGAKSFGALELAGGSGWQMSRKGYLSEGALVTALAIVERLAGRDPLATAPWLKDYLRKDLKRTVRALGRTHSDLRAALDAVDLEEFA